ncbi:MAG: sulfatase [Verrucomicrobia bacterium]|nr:sulfatase [Verrucomicrobiota bacterium]
MKAILLGALLAVTANPRLIQSADSKRPNILIAISDDQSWLHTSALGCRAVRTPAFDRVAAQGVLFRNCFAGSPGCSPSRAALLTGRHHWQLQEAGTHASSFSREYVTFPELLETSGYDVGFTGKGWGPGNWKITGRTRNPAGPEYNQHQLKPPRKGISNNDYAANFGDFLASRSKEKPFCFWFGGHEPHRQYEPGSGVRDGKRLADISVPPFLPDTPEVRSDLLDYCVEIEWFDLHLSRIMKLLEEAGEMENTLVMVTGDNGMPFPRAKANAYEYGIHVPLAIAWPKRVPGSRTVDDLVGFVDLTATILDAANVSHPAKSGEALAMSGRSILSILTSEKQGLVDASRKSVFSGRERHSSSRVDNLGYPCRALRSQDYLYIRNFHPERWPAGDPQKFEPNGSLGPMHGGYHDIDACPTLTFLIEHKTDAPIGRFLDLAVSKRPSEELYDINEDPGCLRNLALDPAFESVRKELGDTLLRYLTETGDPRTSGNPEIWETYRRYSPIRSFPSSL